ncbi:muscle lim protein, putative [Pediculus humanus corporis]|uniref:Muscle lim protein, putative n=1 Tax=Pediculus humanus subsp. corporis TaxID=121224 RepID=E0VVT8_PEDHC|nr:muscle lim protein, putative [Pediculus humanus corporis]EEB17494.1 muscle lim protein, putative [Pediculus humanus corporis]
MPFKPVDHPKCPKCGKSVYAAEERVAGGLKWHKMCFKCGMCNKLLDSTNCAEHEGELFCKVCHARKYGPKGYGFGGGAGCLSMDTGEQFKGESDGRRSASAMMEPRAIARAPEGEGCPRCGGYVYMAEQKLARGRSWHAECFKCGSCSKRLDSTNCCEGPDKDIYCKACYGKRFGPKGYGYGQGGGALQSDDYMNGYAPRTTVIDTAVIKAPPGKGCPRCGGVVYAAEQVLAKGREWHNKCFKCRDCSKTLDSIIACDGPDRDVYCKTCYGKKFGPHGYGFACGSGFLQTDGLTEEEIQAMKPYYNPDTTSIPAPKGQGCPRCGGAVFAAEQQLAKGTMWHKKCFNCADCHRPLDSVLACDGPDREVYCKACYAKKYGPKGFGYGHTPTLVSTEGESTICYPESKPKTGFRGNQPNCCPRCGFVVYAAEQMISKNRVWHRMCFVCADCRKSLDSTNLNDGPDGEIYCRSCYGRNFGPKGVGFGMGAGTLSMA